MVSRDRRSQGTRGCSTKSVLGVVRDLHHGAMDGAPSEKVIAKQGVFVSGDGVRHEAKPGNRMLRSSRDTIARLLGRAWAYADFAGAQVAPQAGARRARSLREQVGPVRPCNAVPPGLMTARQIADPRGYGERAVEFLKFLKHPKSRQEDRALIWDPWQLRIVRKIYGPCRDDGRGFAGSSIFKSGRGNRKTSLGGALALLHTFGPERVPCGQVISAAADRKQARIAFEEAGGIIATTPQLARRRKFRTSKIGSCIRRAARSMKRSALTRRHNTAARRFSHSLMNYGLTRKSISGMRSEPA